MLESKDGMTNIGSGTGDGDRSVIRGCSHWQQVTLAKSFSVQTQEISLPTTLTLKKGRYLFNIKLEKGRPLAKIRVAAK